MVPPAAPERKEGGRTRPGLFPLVGVVLARWAGREVPRYHPSVGKPGRSGRTGRARSKRRVRRFLERFVLGGIMSAVAFVVERQLLKAIRKKGETQAARDREGGLAATPHEIDHQG